MGTPGIRGRAHKAPFNRNQVALGLAQYLRLIDESVAATVLPIGLAARTLRP